MLLTDKLTAIGDAVRAKTGTEDPMTLDEMATAIEGITTGSVDIPEDLLVLTGDQSYKFRSGEWQSFLDTYGKQMRTEGLTSASYMFAGLFYMKELPFSVNSASTGMSVSHMFDNCANLRVCPVITGAIKNAGITQMFYRCNFLPEIPDFTNIDISRLLSYSSGAEGQGFYECSSIREIPMSYYKKLKNRTISKTYTNSPYRYLNSGNYNVDEIIDMPVMTLDKYTSNAFNSAFSGSYCLKNFTFELQEDGTPYVASGWKSQTIDLIQAGHCIATYDYQLDLTYNSGRTTDKRIYNDETYALYKDDINSYVAGKTADNPHYYSRYDKASAIRTINSLPDVSGSGGTNTIKFKGLAGLKTDGGAINTMTEEEIAVATAKGWTVSFA